MLVELRNGEVGAELHPALIGLERAGEQADQRGLAAAVGTDDADAVAALDADGEIADDRAAAIALGEMLGLDHQLAGRVGRAGGDGGAAGGAAIAAALLAQRLQFADPAHVALAPRGDAVAHPVLLGDDLAVELVLLALLFRQQRVAPCLEMGEAALDAARVAAVEPDGLARQVGEKAPVVADDDQRGAAADRARAPAIRWW